MDHDESSPDFSEALLYRQNNKFIEGDSPEPHSAQEIRANLESRLASSETTLSRLGKQVMAWVLVIVNLFIAFMVLVLYMLVIDYEISDRTAGLVLLVGFGLGWVLIKVLIGKRFAVGPVYALKPDAAYKQLVEKAEVVNGTIVDVVKLSDVLITYSVKTPTLTTIQRSYKTSLTRYSREDIGKEVAVLYLNEAVNVLL